MEPRIDCYKAMGSLEQYLGNSSLEKNFCTWSTFASRK